MLRKPVRKSWWVEDRSAEGCQRCKKRFEMLSRRRHHCRFCGALVCHACSKARVVFKEGDGPLRTCDRCLRKIIGRIDAVFDRRYMRAAINVISSNTPPTHEDGFLQQASRSWEPGAWVPPDSGAGAGGAAANQGAVIDEGDDDEESVVATMARRLTGALSLEDPPWDGDCGSDYQPSGDSLDGSRPTSPAKPWSFEGCDLATDRLVDAAQRFHAAVEAAPVLAPLASPPIDGLGSGGGDLLASGSEAQQSQGPHGSNGGFNGGPNDGPSGLGQGLAAAGLVPFPKPQGGMAAAQELEPGPIVIP